MGGPDRVVDKTIDASQASYCTRAVARLRLARLDLSRQIRRLEDELDVPLFARDRCRVARTRGASAFFEHACRNLEQTAGYPGVHFLHTWSRALGSASAEECVVSAIDRDFGVLASPDATDEEKLAALKFLGHWVGDIHQPLHAASRDDRGGNHVKILGSSCGSLHTLWDSCIVEERLGMHPLTIVPELQASITDEERAEWLASDPVDWANEPFAMAREPDVGYCVMVGDTCQYAADNREFDEGEPEKVVVVDGSYLDRHAPIARERIAMAGVRLAGLLDRALGDQSP